MGSKKRFQKSLPVRLNDQEKADYSVILAEKCVKKASLEIEKKEISKGFNIQISALEEDIEHKSVCVASGEEFRDVMCHWIIDESTEMARLIREDTGEIIEEKFYSEGEFQEDLFEKGFD
jgi:hypothetical protein